MTNKLLKKVKDTEELYTQEVINDLREILNKQVFIFEDLWESKAQHQELTLRLESVIDAKPQTAKRHDDDCPVLKEHFDEIDRVKESLDIIGKRIKLKEIEAMYIQCNYSNNLAVRLMFMVHH